MSMWAGAGMAGRSTGIFARRNAFLSATACSAYGTVSARHVLSKRVKRPPIQPGRPHTFAVVGDGAHFIAEFRPAWQIAEVFRDIFAAVDARGKLNFADLLALTARYPDDFSYAPVIPPAFQRQIGRLFARRSRNERSS
jgi:hypothetical protein